MLDKSIPYESVLMVRGEDAAYPRAALPGGFEFRAYRDGYENHWAEVVASVGMAENREKALELFTREFMGDPDEARRSCLFVFDGEVAAAVASLWYGDHFGFRLDRVHWVAARPEYQGRGLVKALMTRLLDLHRESGRGGGVCLVTQTWSWRAVNLYMKYGFEPYLGEKPAMWQRDGYDERNAGAWSLILDKINGRE